MFHVEQHSCPGTILAVPAYISLELPPPRAPALHFNAKESHE